MAEKKVQQGEAGVLEKIAAMPEPWRGMGERIHALVRQCAPMLQPATWYGMPAYAKDGKTICFFRADRKYMTFGLTPDASLAPEEGVPHQLMEAAWLFSGLDEATEAKLAGIIRKAAI